MSRTRSKTIAMATALALISTPSLAKDKKPRRPGTGMMVTGIVFTPITGLITLGAALAYADAKDYDCNHARHLEDGSARGEDFREARENCYSEKKDYLQEMAVLGGVSLALLGGSVLMIINGALQRREGEAAETTTDRFDVRYDRTKTLALEWTHAL